MKWINKTNENQLNCYTVLLYFFYKL